MQQVVQPDNQLLFIDIDLDTRIVRNIPIRSMSTFDAATGYLLTDLPKMTPDYVTVSGARNVITRIIEIPTDSVSFSGLVHDTTYSIPLDFEHPDFKAALRRILDACKAAGKPTIIYAGTIEDARKDFEMGFTSVAYNQDGALLIEVLKAAKKDILGE